jgi:hydroxymethylpyrimidine pyrophosphatase-like HAD family hydrolase
MVDIPGETGHSGLALCANGALLLDLATQQIVRARTLDADVGLHIASLLRQIDPGMAFAVEVAAAEGDFIVDESYRPRWEPLATPPRMAVEQMFAAGNVVKLLARPSHDSGHDADSILMAALDVVTGMADITHSDVNDLLLEVSALGVNKGSGLADVAADLGIAQEAVAAVGDMPNDIPMLQWAGRGAAVANAHDWVKAVADEHLPSNDDHAVSVFIERLLG